MFRAFFSETIRLCTNVQLINYRLTSTKMQWVVSVVRESNGAPHDYLL